MAETKKIALIVGARPQFMKALPVISRSVPGYDWLFIHTGQHYDYKMSQLFFDELGIPKPDVHLEVGDMPPAKQLAAMVSGLSDVFREDKPALVVVFGDTNSTLAGALAASFSNIPLAHIEAGMRSFEDKMPEERNRVLTDRLADILLYPTDEAGANLETEELSGKAVNIGDPMYEVAWNSINGLPRDDYLKVYNVSRGGYIYVTCHRQKSVDDKLILGGIVEAILALDLPTVFPVHPRTEERLKRFGLWGELADNPNVIICEPAGYFASLSLIYDASAVVTDSGGVQREAYLFDVPVVTLRDETEWPETVESGANVLAGTDTGKIINAVKTATNKHIEAREPRYNLVGSPPPSERIINAISDYLLGT